MFEIRQTESFANWFGDLKDRKAKQIIAKRLVRVEAGLLGDSRAVGGSVSEIRIHFGPGYRLYYMQHGETIIVLLCGGDKGSQTRDIERAQAMVLEIENENDEV
jgi:putative addiction module killer protein